MALSKMERWSGRVVNIFRGIRTVLPIEVLVFHRGGVSSGWRFFFLSGRSVIRGKLGRVHKADGVGRGKRVNGKLALRSWEGRLASFCFAL